MKKINVSKKYQKYSLADDIILNVTGRQIALGEIYPNVTDEDNDRVYEMIHDMNTEKNLVNVMNFFESMTEKYPNVPIFFYNHKTVKHKVDGGKNDDKEAAKKIIDETIALFPNYFFACLRKGYLMLEEEASIHDILSKLFGGKMTLPEIYPDREFFHVDEVVSFHTFCTKLFGTYGCFNKSFFHIKIALQFDNNNSQNLKELFEKLNQWKKMKDEEKNICRATKSHWCQKDKKHLYCNDKK